jgi:hypothetical protein
MFTRTRLLAAFATLVLALTSGVAFAGAYATATQRALPAVHVAPTTAPAPSPSPSATPIMALGANHRPLPPLPPMPTTSSSHYRKIKSATGACIVFSWNPGCADATAGTVENFTAGATITWNAALLPASGTHTDYYAASTNGNASTTASLTVEGVAYAGATGTTHSITASTNGVYVFATLNNTTNTWDAIAYILVGPTPDVETYTDGTLSTKTQTYTTNTSGNGVTVYLGATVLTTTDTYMVGIEDQLTGACVFTAPSSAQTTITGAPYNLCNLTSSAATGAIPNNNGLILANWAVQLGTSPVPPEGGTYMATIFDQTTGQRVASRVFSVIDGRATAGTGRVDLQFEVQGSTTYTTTGPTTRVAWNGVTSTVDDSNYNDIQLFFGATGLPVSTDNYNLVVTDPTGNVAHEFTGVKTNSGLTTITPSNNQWELPTQSVPFELAYPGSTWTATIYDTTLGKLVAETSFQILGYTTRWEWTAPTDTTTLNISSGTTLATSLQLTNTSDLTFGANNGDPGQSYQAVTVSSSSTAGITDMTLQGPSQSTACDVDVSPYSCTAIYSDSAGNAWSVNLSCLYITGGTPANCSGTGSGMTRLYAIGISRSGTTTGLNPGGSLDITGLVVSATGCTAAACYFNTNEVPLDAVDPGVSSAYGGVSNEVYVTNGTGTVSATGSVGLAGYYDSSNTWHAIQDAGYTPRCATTNADCVSAGVAQSILANNQPFIGAASKVVLAYTLKNTSSAYTINIFDLSPPAGFSLASAAIDTAHTPNGATLTTSGYCDGEARITACITPSTPVPANGSQTFYVSFTPPSTSFSYTDVIGTIIQDSNGYGAVSIPVNPTTSSVSTFIGTPTTVDSTAIGAYSLNGGLMTAAVSPTSVGTSTTNNLTFNLRNTTAGADPFPDEVDMVAVQFPSQAYISVPTSCTSVTTTTAGWSCQYVNTTAGVTTFYFGQCPQQVTVSPVVPASSTSFGSDDLAVCPFALPNEPYSLTAGSTFSATIPVTSNASVTATPITISSFGHGATTDAWSTPITSTLSVVATAAAGAGFSSITGPGGTLTGTTQGNEPSVTGDYQGSSPNYYDTYVYKVKNTGSVPITSVTIAIPSQDTTGSNGADSAGTIWDVTATPTLIIERTGNANGCTASAPVNPVSGTSTPGSMSITCPSGDFIAGDTLDVTFLAKTPLKINATYAFTPTVNGSATAVSPNWTDDEDILIALSATVSVTVNPSAACGGTASATGFAVSTATQTFNFGVIGANKYYYCKDAMIVQVTTDASTPTNWSLYASAGGNPSATAAVASATGTASTESTTNELLVSMDPTNSTGGTTSPAAASIPCSTTTCFTYDNTTYTPIALTGSGTGTRLGYTTNGGTNVNNGTVTFDVNYQVAVGTETVPTTGEQETITYTWIAN